MNVLGEPTMQQKPTQYKVVFKDGTDFITAYFYQAKVNVMMNDGATLYKQTENGEWEEVK